MNIIKRLLFEGNLFLILFLLIILNGCAGTTEMPDKSMDPQAGSSDIVKETTEGQISEIKIQEFILSPGDEIKISVYLHDELTRAIKIPLNGIIFYPMVGEIDIKGKSLKELRDIITKELSKYKDQTLSPGDEISIAVYRNEDMNRRFIIPSDGNIFFPFIGHINIEGKSLREITQVIKEGVSKYVKDPQVSIDIVKLSNPARIADPQVNIEVTGFGGQKVFILGEINRPGVFLADGTVRVVEALSLAGGPTLDAKLSSILIIRPTPNKPQPELIVVDVEKVLEEGNMLQNPVLQRGDIIFVPRTFIAHVDRFFEHLSKIVKPLLDIETGYWIGQNIEAGPSRTTGARTLP